MITLVLYDKKFGYYFLFNDTSYMKKNPNIKYISLSTEQCFKNLELYRKCFTPYIKMIKIGKNFFKDTIDD